mmetsp:Transcript_37925/g.83252  ORF Transcript_37925/g.83252 Transcript_37925/m.83252 type:complete len:82 (-) Transcript_37925:65-310(-)
MVSSSETNSGNGSGNGSGSGNDSLNGSGVVYDLLRPAPPVTGGYTLVPLTGNGSGNDSLSGSGWVVNSFIGICTAPFAGSS